MALARFFFVTFLPLFPLLIVASANDYYSYSSEPKGNKSKSDQGYDKELDKTDSEDKSKSKSYGYNTKPDFDWSKLDQGYDKDLEKAESENESNSKSYGYYTKPDFDLSKLDQGYDKDLEKQKTEDKYKSKSYGYDSKPDVEKSNSENQGYNPKPDVDKSKTEDKPVAEKSKPKPENHGYGPKLEEKEKSFLIGIQGIVLCKSGPKCYPIQGAVARITCFGVEENGYEKKSVFSCRGTTDEKGYFFAKLSPSEFSYNLKLTQCKAFLEKSPSETCKIPTDVNKRISGALLTSSRILNDNKTKVYSLKPIFFTSEAESTPTGY